jgi:membrane-associated phospholipid phosphatase
MVGLFLASRKKKYTWPVLIFPLLMGMSRIYLMVHYASDVLAGLVAGTICGVAAYFIVKALYGKLIEAHADKKFCRLWLRFDLIEAIRSRKGNKADAE